MQTDLSDNEDCEHAATQPVAAVGEARWRELLADLGAEIAGPLTRALERVQELVRTGRIERHGLRALREELEAARKAGMIGQQLERLGSGRLFQSHERLSLTLTLRGVLAQRERETQARGIQLKQVLRPVEVIVDPSLLFGLLNSVLDWALANARSSIELRIDMKTWPARARLHCRFARLAPDEPRPSDAGETASRLDSLTWRLIEQSAWAMELGLERHDEPGRSGLTLEFPRTVSEEIASASAVEIEIDDRFAPSSLDSKPLAGSQVLVVASRREMRNLVRESIRHMGLMVDFVHSVADAADFCKEGLPHAVIYEAALAGDRFQQLRRGILEEAPNLAFIELIEEGSLYEASGVGGRTAARVGRDAISGSLPSALIVELSKSL